MIQIYKADNVDYNKNGDVTLFPVSAIVHPILNGTWEATIKHPIDNEGRWKYIIEEAVVKMPSFNGNQLFRIKEKTKSDSGITATLEPIFMDAIDDCFLVDVRPTNKTGSEALNIMTAPNSKYIGESDITERSTAYYQYKNLIEAINGEEDNSFINRWGGEILFDNYKVLINKRVGGDYGVELRYGKNIPADGISEEVDIREVVTRIYPKSYNGYTMTGNGYVDSALINSYPTVKAATITFEEVKMRADAQEDDAENGITICDTQEQLDAALKGKCREQFEQGIDKPKVTISAKMVLLQNTELYKDYQILESVSLGDTIHCKNNHLGIVTDARVIELEYDSILKKVTSVVLGDFIYNYFNNVSSAVNRIDKAIRSDGSVIAEQVAGIIDGVKSQMRAQSSIAKKSDVRAILFEDLDPNSKTFGAMCLGTMGFQIAGYRTADNRDWDWRTFGTGQGFFADHLVSGSLRSRNWIKDLVGFRMDLDEGTINSKHLKLDADGLLTIYKALISGGELKIGGGDGNDGYIIILDASGNEIGRWDKEGLVVKSGSIQGVSIIIGGKDNKSGTLSQLDGNGKEISKMDNLGILSSGRIASMNPSTGLAAILRNGQLILQNNSGEIVSIVSYANDGLTLQSYGGSTSHVVLKRNGDVNIWAEGNLAVVCKGKLTVNGREIKSGRAVFSDGSYLDFAPGGIVGGKTTEGGSF